MRLVGVVAVSTRILDITGLGLGSPGDVCPRLSLYTAVVDVPRLTREDCAVVCVLRHRLRLSVRTTVYSLLNLSARLDSTSRVMERRRRSHAPRRGGGGGGAGAAARPARPPGLRGSRAAVQFYFNDTLLMSLDTACMCVPCRFTQMNECSVQSVVCARLCVVLVGQG